MLIIIEGIDRTGKSTIAEYFKSLGYEYIHMSAPDKKYMRADYAGPSYLDDMAELLLSFTGRNVVLDRSHMGERIWPLVYGRASLLTEDDIEVLRELETGLNTRRILMTDPDTAAHWKRCVDNNEPLDRAQFNLANKLYSEFSAKYDFEVWTLPMWNEGMNEKPSEKMSEKPQFSLEEAEKPADFSLPKEETMSAEQKQLAYANAVNTLLSKPLIKQKGWPYDELERDLKSYLNGRLGILLGKESPTTLTAEDVNIVKNFVKMLKDKNKK